MTYMAGCACTQVCGKSALWWNASEFQSGRKRFGMEQEFWHVCTFCERGELVVVVVVVKCR